MHSSIGEKRRRPVSWQDRADDVWKISGVIPSRDDRRRDPEGRDDDRRAGRTTAGGACE